MEEYTFRAASLKDIDFIIKTIIEAEKSGTDKIGIARLFNLSEFEVVKYLKMILNEEIIGCEFSISSFMVAEINGNCVAAVGGWKEGENDDDLPSAILKSNLLGFVLPSENILFGKLRSKFFKDIQIERAADSYQIEYVYVDSKHRGQNLSSTLINKHIEKSKDCKDLFVQVFANNYGAIKLYEKLGFSIYKSFKSEYSEILDYLPCNEKHLMKKNI